MNIYLVTINCAIIKLLGREFDIGMIFTFLCSFWFCLSRLLSTIKHPYVFLARACSKKIFK